MLNSMPFYIRDEHFQIVVSVGWVGEMGSVLELMPHGYQGMIHTLSVGGMERKP